MRIENSRVRKYDARLREYPILLRNFKDMKKYVGIDISKKDFHTSIPLGSDYEEFNSEVFSNDEAGVSQFIKKLQGQSAELHCVMEATGNYSLLLTYSLVEAGIAVSVINPKSSAMFRQMKGEIIKTDDIDGRLLSWYGKQMEPKQFQPKTDAMLQLKQQRSVLNQLQKILIAQKNQRHALTSHPFTDEFSLEIVENTIAHLEQSLKTVKTKMRQIAQADFEEQYQLLISIKSIGKVIATTMIEVTGGFTLFTEAKPFMKFIGTATTTWQSGTSVKIKGQINRSGDPKIRALLYIASWSAIRYNKACKALYERLKAAGKPSKVALVAVMNKLIRQMFGVIKNGQKFDNDYEEKTKRARAAKKTEEEVNK